MSDGADYTVVWAEQAVVDLESIIAFMAQSDPLSARRLLDRLRAQAEALEHLAERGRTVPELAAFGLVGVREVIVRPYRLVYRLDRQRVTVMAVFDGRRDLGDVLFDRLLRS